MNNGLSAAHVSVQLERPLNVLMDDTYIRIEGLLLAKVWDKSSLFTERDSGMEARILAELSEELTQLAAEYYKANRSRAKSLGTSPGVRNSGEARKE